MPLFPNVRAKTLLVVALFGTALAAALHADTAPQFSLTSLDGRTFTNSGLRGNVVLLQFWTTWCPVCRQDQPAVERVQADFGGDGLVVIGIDDGEPAELVRKYLAANPRSTPIVVNDGRSLAARFAVHSYPHYVVIDRSGNVTASRPGGGGEPYLRALLRTAGLGAKSQTLQAGVPPASGSGPQWTNVVTSGAELTGKPLPKTIFVFTNGDRMEADQYVLYAKFLRVNSEGQERSIPLTALDITKTVGVNHERGIELKIPSGGSEMFLAF